MLSPTAPWMSLRRPPIARRELAADDADRAVYDIPASDAEFDAYRRIAGHAFMMNDDSASRFLAMSHRESLRIIRSERDRQTVAGGLTMVPMGQYFGGRSVPMVGIAAVAIDPGHRAGGAGSRLMANMLRDAQAAGYPLSGLYPATQPIYRRVGYEQAGSRWQVDLDLLSIEAERSGHDVSEVNPEDPEAFARLRAIYEQRAVARDGHLDRREYIWRRMFHPYGEKARVFTVHPAGRPDAPEGYISYRLADNPAEPGRQKMVVTDLQVVTLEAAMRMASFLRMHRSMATIANIFLAPHDLMFRALREQWMKVSLKMMWMLRIVDVKAALEARGYPADLATSFDLEVYGDTVLPELNNRRFRVTIEGGRAQVEADAEAGVGAGAGTCAGSGAGKGIATGASTIRLHINALASLYSGFLTALELAEGMSITVSPVGAAVPIGRTPHGLLRRLSLPFAGATPWMPDMF